MNKTATYTIGGVVIIAAIAGGFLVWHSMQKNGGAPLSQATTTNDSASGLGLGGIVGDYTIKEITQNPQPQKDFDAMLAQGTSAERKGDYAGAEKIYLSIIETWPNDTTAYNNLAALYLYDTKQYQKAEEYYKKVVQLNPHDINAFSMLFAIYSEKLYVPTPTAAVDILKQAIAANPKNVQIEIMLARYYKALGRTQDAQAEYQAAITNANSQGQSELAASIQTEASGQ